MGHHLPHDGRVLMITPGLNHKAKCAAEEADLRRFTGHLGDRLVRCLSCRALAVDLSPTTTAVEPLPAGMLTRWRCADHDRPVDHRGRGCAQCVEDRRRKPRPKPDETEW